MDSIKIAFLNVGHGDSSVIIFSDEKSAGVIDTPNAQITYDYLKKNNIICLKWVMISHTHNDHIYGIVGLIEQFKQEGGIIETLYYNYDDIRFKNQNNKNTRYKVFLQRIRSLKEQNIIKNHTKPAIISISFNPIKDIHVEILHPAYEDIGEILPSPNRKNDTSVVVKILFGKVSILFTGDLSEEGWKWLKSRNFDLKSDILKYPHHGSWFESIPELIDSVNPQYVILSYGETSEKKYRLPAHETTACLTERKIQTFSTKVSHQEFMITTELIKHLCDSQSLEV